MSTCPSCGTTIEEDFGLVTCGQCGTSLFVEIDGSVQWQKSNQPTNEGSMELVSDAENFQDLGVHQEAKVPFATSDLYASPHLPPPIPLKAHEEIETKSGSNIHLHDENLQATATYHEYESEELIAEDSLELVATEEPPNDDFPNEAYTTSIDETQFEVEAIYDQEELDLDENESNLQTQPTTEETLQEVAAFGNSDQSLAREGIYTYTLRIEGIDSGDIKYRVKETLSNSRLKLNADELLTNMSQGLLTLRDLNPVKAFIIVNELKGLPLEIYWEQHDITS